MSAAVAHEAKAWLKTRSHYPRLRWERDDQGARIAQPVGRGERHDLRGPVRNSRGDTVQTLLCLDVDVEGSDPRLLVDEGLRVDVFLSCLAQDLPYCASMLRYVVRTPGGGFHPLFTIVPLPLRESTVSNQRLLLSIQDLMARYLSLIGYKVDRAAFGLGKTYASPDNRERLLYASKEDRAWKLKKKSRRVLSLMRNELEAALARFSVYQGQVKTEKKFAGLLSDLFQWDEKHVIECSVAELHARTGIGLAILRRIVHREPIERLPWLRVEPMEAYGQFALRLNYECPDLGLILARARQLFHDQNRPSMRKAGGGEYGVGALIPPELVCDGERNAAMRNYTYVLKHAGLSTEEVTEALVRLSTRFPSSEGARHRKRSHIKDVVGCFFRRQHVLFPLRYVLENLPSWLGEALTPSDCPNVTQHRRKSRDRLRVVPASSQDQPSPPRSEISRERGYGEHVAAGLSPAWFSSSDACLWERPDEPRVVRLYAVPHRTRIGIFDGDQLVLCVTRCRNYVPSRVAEYIQRTLPQYRGRKIIVRKVRDGSSIVGAEERISTTACVIPSRLACGAAETLDASLARWRDSRNARPGNTGSIQVSGHDEPLPF